jgi:putative endonuclease
MVFTHIYRWIKEQLRPKTPAQATGQWAERLACNTLRRKGYRILQRNWRPAEGHGELDIIAAEGEQIVFVEVRARQESARVPGAHSLGQHKRHTLRQTAHAYLRQKRKTGAQWRVDIVEVSYRSREEYQLYHYEGVRL